MIILLDYTDNDPGGGMVFSPSPGGFRVELGAMREDKKRTKRKQKEYRRREHSIQIR